MKLLMFCAGLLASIPAYSQKDLSPGYLVSLTGDTLRGKIDYRNWTKNPREITFVSENGNSNVYTAQNIQAISITGRDFYKSAIVTRSTRPVQVSELSYNTGDLLVSDTLFLRQLVSGPWNLYEYIDFKDHYYMQVNDGPISELRYELSLGENGNNFTERNIFRNQLNVELAGTRAENKLAPGLEYLKYSEQDLTRFFESVNLANSGTKNSIATDKKMKLSFYGGIAVMYDGFKASGNTSVYLTHINFISSVRPGIQAGVDIISARKMQKLVIRAELQYYSYQVSGKGQMQKPGTYEQLQLDYLLRMNSVKPSINIFYKVVKKPGLDVFLGAGLGENFSSYAKDQMTVTDTAWNSTKIYGGYGDYYKHWTQITASAGITVLNKFEAVLVFPLWGNFTRFVMVDAKPKIIGLQLNYKFKS